ncbi:MAG: hypothetical protein ACREXY_25840, partial [Gammaproteobacteria bacterium]
MTGSRGRFRQAARARAGIHRDCLRTWEGSSDAVPRAQYRTLCRLIHALEAETSASATVVCTCSALLRPGPSFTAMSAGQVLNSHRHRVRTQMINAA